MTRTARTLATIVVPLFLTAASALVAQTSADLSVTVADAPDPVLDGGQITYTIVVANQGPDDAQSVQMIDSFPPGATFVSLGAPAGWTCDSPTPASLDVTCTAATLAHGASQTFTLVVDTQTVGAGVSMTDRATVGAQTPDDPFPDNNDATATTTVQAWSDLSIAITDDPDPVLAGAGLFYTITFPTVGPDLAASPTVSFPLPPGTTFAWIIATGWTCSTPAVGAGGTVSCSIPVLTSDQMLMLRVDVDPTLPSGTVLSAAATVSSETFDPVLANNTASTTTTVSGVVSPAVISATKTVAGDFSPGGAVTYTVVLRNSGPATQHDNFGPEFQDLLTVDLRLTAASATSGTTQINPDNGTVLWNGSIPANGSVTITVQATIDPTIPIGAVVFNQGDFFYDADGDGTNEALGGTDDPNVSGTADPTLFTVGQASSPAAIPTLDEMGLVLLALLLAAGGAVMLRRRRA